MFSIGRTWSALPSQAIAFIVAWPRRLLVAMSVLNFAWSGWLSTLPSYAAPPVDALAMAPYSAPGRSILASNRLVTYYGNPWSSEMGILGQLGPEELVTALKRRAAQYEQIGGKPVIPAIHLVATVAQADAGTDGMYRFRMPDRVIQEYADLAARNDMLLILDIQVGQSTVQEEVDRLRPFLELPQVHLALDPEFDMWKGQRPGVQIGHMTAAEINYAQRVLADIVERHGYANKILIVHQFTPFMIVDKEAIEHNPLVDLAIVMDGFGGQSIKIEHYHTFVRDEPVEFGGIKLFFDQDIDLMTPSEALDLDPRPDVIIYQ